MSHDDPERETEATLDALAPPLAQAIGRMLLIPEDEKPVIVVEDALAGRFVQFCVHKGKIVVDLPKAPEGGNVAVDEALARAFLTERNDLGDGVISFLKRCEDLTDAVCLALVLFSAVHKLPPDAKLLISEWRQW